MKKMLMKKNMQLNQWLWKWHVIAGLITLPFMFLLAITGVIYLFKDDVNKTLYKDILVLQMPETQLSALPLTQQLAAVQNFAVKPVASVTLPQSVAEPTAFKLQGRGRAGEKVYVNPYTAEVTGSINRPDTLMYKIRKLHGELLLSKPGTLVIELVASWFIVLLLSGLYIWWPKGKGWGKGVLLIRTKSGARTFWRDLHAVFGFWLSVFMLAIIAGGMPWTDVFGGQLKWVQKQTNTGYPQHWINSNGLQSSGEGSLLTLDEVADIVRQKNLEGQITINLPGSKSDVYRISNRAFWLEQQQVVHLNKYTGEVIKSLQWQDVGILMELRQIFMRLHQGEYGFINWLGVMLVALFFIVSTFAGLYAYLLRKPKGGWGIPYAAQNVTIGKGVAVAIIALGILFPLFGASLVLLWVWQYKSRWTAAMTNNA